ncbi:MAG: lipid-A-disaccharide synthase [Pseudomonadales bacterium]|nr:lipid-A-disaccharide synthase [Pseudomonadales bacterium]
MVDKPIRIGIVAGEMSGDLLGAGLIQSIKQLAPQAEFIGIGGPKMIDAGCRSLFPMERLSVMGIVEVLGRITELLAIRKTLIEELLKEPPDIFIGIDSPDFVIPVELKLRQHNIKTVHYVSPSVWAWRQRRVHKIKRAVNLMLTLFPFEAAFYEQHQVPVRFVGHPLANLIDPDLDVQRAKQHWGYGIHDRVVAVLPGSRGGELKHMGPLFIDTMRRMHLMDPRIKFVVPLANAERKAQFEQQLMQLEQALPVQLIDGHAREVMSASDAVLATSGTATLEAMLLKRPMVVAFRWGAITHAIISRLVKTDYIALPNLLANETLVPEYLQDEAKSEVLAKDMLEQLNNTERRDYLKKRFDEIHHSLRKNANYEAADAVLALIEYDLG